MMAKTQLSLTLLVVLVGFACLSAHAEELNTILMNSTFEITGPAAGKPGKTAFGTGFIMGKPLRSNPLQAYRILITAAHVLTDISGDDAQIILRKLDSNGEYLTFPYPLRIRDKGKNLFKVNPDADVAAMYLPLPVEAVVEQLPISYLATDAELKRIEVHPGDELLCLGFPLGVSFNSFPVLRSGLLASYPITPSKIVKSYMYTFHVFPGNSGGPVYYSYTGRTFGNSAHFEESPQGVIGLVIQQWSSTIPEYKDQPLDVAVVVPSSFILDTIALLPESPSM